MIEADKVILAIAIRLAERETKKKKGILDEEERPIPYRLQNKEYQRKQALLNTK